MTATAFTQRRELAHRTSDGIEVTLFWSKPSQRVTITVYDSRSGEALEFDVDGGVAMDAFNHRYEYAATHHVRNSAISRAGADPLIAATDRQPPPS
jgi:hypothetical protein